MMRKYAEKIWDQAEMTEDVRGYIGLYIELSGKTFDEIPSRDIMLGQLKEALSALEPIERQVISILHGIGREKNRVKACIARELNVAPRKINHIEKAAMKKLKTSSYVFSVEKKKVQLLDEFQSGVSLLNRVQSQDVEDLFIEDLACLSDRTKSLLTSSRIYTVYDLTHTQINDVKLIPRFGKKSLDEFRNAVRIFSMR